jgi:hypothetical protein
VTPNTVSLRMETSQPPRRPPLLRPRLCIVAAYDEQKGGCKKRSNADKMLRARAREGSDLLSTMKELINIIVQKTGISEENAQKTVQVTLGFLKAKLPTPLAAQLDSFLSTRTTVVSPVAVGANA